MKDEALFYATTKVAASSSNGLGLVLLGGATLGIPVQLLIINVVIGIVMLSAAIYIERYLCIPTSSTLFMLWPLR
jgi:hypothetical protein